MSIYFADTSALAKRYVKEPGSRWIKTITRYTAGNLIVVAELMVVEMYSVFARREAAGEITTSTAERFRRAFSVHMNTEYTIMRVSSATFTAARDLVTKHVGYSLRTLDAIQLTCAIEAQKLHNAPITLLTADVKMKNAALAEGIHVDDPNAHP